MFFWLVCSCFFGIYLFIYFCLDVVCFRMVGLEVFFVFGV